MTTYIRTCIYHDSSTKGFRHGIRSELTLTREEAQARTIQYHYRGE